MKEDCISIYDLSKEDILYLLNLAEQYTKRERYVSDLKDRKLGLLFFENSTRTKKSFDTAITELGGFCYDLNVETSSVQKHESLRDTVMMALAHNCDALAIRHSKDGSVQWCADISNKPVINAGDGKNQHPTQTLLDLFTIKQVLGRLDNLHIGFGGDLKFGRTVHSLPIGLRHFENVTIHLAAPEELQMPQGLIDHLVHGGVKVVRHETLIEALQASDIFYQTRAQIERMNIDNPQKIYQMLDSWRITPEILHHLGDGKIMHPLPIDSHLEEISFAVAFTPQQMYYQQAHNGVTMRKALLAALLEQRAHTSFSGSLVFIKQENRIPRIIQPQSFDEKLYIDRIPEGVVVDHLEARSGVKMAEELLLYDRGCPLFIGTNVITSQGDRKDVIKIIGAQLSERDLKKIAMNSPDCTVNIIRNNRIVEKFQYLICRNENCISREITEDVPPRFFNDLFSNKIRCRYCQKSYSRRIRYISEPERQSFLHTLPTR